jgi:tetratricopeptide (TPR) repeat protein
MEKPPAPEELAEMFVIRSLMSQSRFMKKRYANDALALNPESVSALNALGDACELPEEALEAYRKAAEILYNSVKQHLPIHTAKLETAPREVFLWFKIMFNLAWLSRVAGLYDESIATVKKLLTYNPSDDTNARAELIASFILKGSFREARVILESLEQQDAVTIVFDGFLAYLLNNDLESSLRSFDEAMLANPMLAGKIVGEKQATPTLDENSINLDSQAEYIIEVIKQIFERYPSMEEAFENAIFSAHEPSDEE